MKIDEKTIKKTLLIILIQSLMATGYMSAQKKFSLDWSIAASLPIRDSLGNPSGVAGAFTGIHNNVLLIAGGANFPNAMPWDGGKKEYWDEIYLLNLYENQNFIWYTQKKFNLNKKIAYGASVSTDQGVVCIGGESESGITNEVFLMQWNCEKEQIITKVLPNLPIPLASASAVAKGELIYVAGGVTNNAVSDKFYVLDLKNIHYSWKELPAIPKPVSHAVMTLQAKGLEKNIYLIGGRMQTSSGISKLYRAVFEFDFIKMKWIEKKHLPYPLSAGTGVATESSTILLFGGDDGNTFHKTEVLISQINSEYNDVKRKKLIERKNKIQQTHPGFDNRILKYNSMKNKWVVVGRIPFETSVTTTAVKRESEIFIPSGEIRAGIRTPDILTARLNYKK